MSSEIKSVLRKVLEDIRESEDLGLNKELFELCVGRSKINEKDKRKMLWNVSCINSNEKLIGYVYNCVLKYEGCGVIK